MPVIRPPFYIPPPVVVGSTPYAFVQQGQFSANNAGTTTVEFSTGISETTSGNLLVVVVTYDRGAGAPTFTIADLPDGNNTWYALASGIHDGSQYGMAAFYAYNNTGGVTGARCTFSNSVAYPAIYLAEFSGIRSASDPLTGTPAYNVQNTPTTGTDATTSGNTTPSSQPALLFGFSQDILGTTPAPVAGTGFTSLTSVWDYEGVISVSARPEHKRITTTDAVAATFTAQVNERHISMVAAFLEP